MRFNRPVVAIVMTLASFGVAAARAGEHWPQWRGPELDGTSDAKKLPLTWSEDENVVWKTPLPAWGGSSPVIWGDRIFLLSPSKKSADDQSAGEGRKLPPFMTKVDQSGGPDILLMCFDKKTGMPLWQQALGSGNKLMGKHNMASPSPVTDGRHVWAISGTGVVACFDMEGEEKWRHDLQGEYGEFGLYWGYASSPLLYRKLLIVQVLHGAANQAPSYVVAFDKTSGEVTWKTQRDTGAEAECVDAYTTPIVIREGKKDRIVISGADYVTAHDPRTGREIWRAGGLNPDRQQNYRLCGTPICVNKLVIATSRIRPILAYRSGGEGDVSDTHVAWTFDDLKGPDVPSAVSDGKRVYLVNDKGFITCISAKTGKTIWGPERLAGGTYSASPLLADGRLYITNEDCETTVLAAGPKHKELARNKLDGGYTLSSWAVSGNQMFLRAGDFLYCIGEKARKSKREG